MALIIEELNRANRVQTRYRMEGDRFTLGRGYDNDAIIEDMHADAEHAAIERREDGCYYLCDLDSTNGVQLLGNNRGRPTKYTEIEQERMVESGDEIQLGKTHLRLINSEASMPPAVPVHSLENILHHFAHPFGAIALLALVAALTLLISYLGFAQDYQWTTAINVVIASVVGLLLYAGAWAFIGRVVRHDTQFFTHLTIAALGALVYTTWEWFSSLLDFNFALGRVIPLLNIAVLAVLLPTMLWCACYLATNISPRWRLGVALALPLGFLGLSLAEDIANVGDFQDVPQISTEIKYQQLLWREPVPLNEFIADTQRLFDIPIEQDDDEPQDAEPENAVPENENDDESAMQPETGRAAEAVS